MIYAHHNNFVVITLGNTFMSYLPTHIETELAKKYRASSINVMANGVKRVIKGVLGISGRTKVPYDKKHLLDYEKVKSFVDGLDKESVKRALIHNVWVVLQRENGVNPELLQKYEQLHKQYSGEYKRSYTWQAGNPDKYISLEAMAQKMEAFGKSATTYEDILKYVVLALYVYMPALRGEDWYTMKKERDGHSTGMDGNYLNIKTGEIVLSKYKTSETHGERRLRIPPELGEVMEIWFGVNKTDYLLAKQDGEPLVGNDFTLLMNKALGLRISTSDLRKIYIAEILKYMHTRSDLSSRDILEWRKKLAHAMGHSVEMQEFVYSGYRDDQGYIRSPPSFMTKVFERLEYAVNSRNEGL